MPEITDKQYEMFKTIQEADVVIVLREKGQAGGAYFKGIGVVPSNVQVNYGEKDDPPLTIRQVTVKAGWTLDKWRRMDRTGLHESTEEAA